MKNGFHQPPQVMSQYLPPAFVPGSQTGPSTGVPQAPIYGTHGQSVSILLFHFNFSISLFVISTSKTGCAIFQVPSAVFPMPPNYANYGHWPGFFGMGHEQISQMYPMNGLAPQHQPSSTYPKTLSMNPRPRNPKYVLHNSSFVANRIRICTNVYFLVSLNSQVRPRRPPPTSSDNQGINGVVGAGGTGTNTTTAVSAHQSYSNPSRKNTSAPPPPLLNIVPNTPTLPLVNPTGHNHSQGHLSHSSVQVSGNAISQNGRQQHYVNNPLPSSHSLDSYHPSGSMRPYRGVGDSR